MILSTEFWWNTGLHGTDMPVFYNDGTFVTTAGQTGTWILETDTGQLSMVFDPGQVCDSLWIGTFSSPTEIAGSMSCQNGVPAWGTWVGTVLPITPTPMPSSSPTSTISPTPSRTPTATSTPTSTPTLTPAPFHDGFIPLLLSGYANYFSGPWEIEPNDSYLGANGPLETGMEYWGYPDDDRDYFSIYLNSSGQISIELSNHTGQGVQLQLFYESVANRVAFQPEPPYHILYGEANAGVYYIYIYSAGNYNQTMPYTLQIDYP